MVDDHKVITIWFHPDVNRFFDEFGSVINNIWTLITPGQCEIFKKDQFIYVVPNVTNKFLVEMIYGDEK